METISPPKIYKRVIQLELNEISKSAVDRLVSLGKLPNFREINHSWTHYQTTSEQQYDHLEPWIQWITAHTGKSFAEHNIFRLSDAIHLKHPQIWEALSEHGVESYIVGSMNAVRGNAKGGFFFPDPWSKNGVTYPEAIQPLWNLISKKVQTHATGAIKLKDLIQGFQICRQFKLPLSLYRKIAWQLISQKLNPILRWKLPGIFDLFLMEIFKTVVNQKKEGFYTLFLNSVAHYQHHYWRNFQPGLFNEAIKSPDCRRKDDPMTYGLEIYDQIIGFALDLAQDPDTLVIIASGLSQKPFVKHEAQGGMNYYRLYNHAAFVEKLGLRGYRVLPMMSRDWQIEASQQADLDHAKKVLSALHVNNEPLFKISQNTPTSLFIETAITRGVTKKTFVQNHEGKTLGKFKTFFRNTAVKSGHHTGEGSLWLSDPALINTNTTPLTTLYPLTLKALSQSEFNNTQKKADIING